MNATKQRTTPWIMLIVIHAIGVAVTAILFTLAAIVEGEGGRAAMEAAAAWAMAGVVLAPLITLVTALWWYWDGGREPLPSREQKPYGDLPVRLSSLQRRAA
ncbi:hypothetical protein GCM10011490_12220 [Pseudoclavibacter endophyticus]|uniref:Uncharacterized protein n=1 Tax=Pseudoclavibacter endophyticus TaxID=1778590 RepID=A0A6H9WST6_9MICO|nr:hypothetical protein [Pseudoclavibacter endophyticus]KAB1649360.1 hypothetical protein F8O04_03580 [Pseudoclavibacter endophyticus]GGA63206.1 hypothetical protein GCM10011490_12220 [Pseudoclavibacter endophyticus]